MGQSNTNHKKIIFLDIDGTITNRQCEIPESARLAICRAMEAGHELVLCTGRPKVQISRQLMKMGFTGIVSGAGAHVERKEKLIYQYVIPPEQLHKLVEFYEKNGILYILQSISGVSAPREMVENQEFLWKGSEIPKEKRELLFGKLLEETAPFDRMDVEKSCFYQSPVSLTEIKRQLGEYFQVEESSYQMTDYVEGEITCRGVDKASGMRRYLTCAGASIEDTIAIGDGPNDREMLAFVGTAVAMGNAKDELKKIADLVTDHVENDGLYHAFLRLGLIGEL